MNHNDYKILDKKIIYQGYAKVELYTIQNRLFSGVWSQPYVREISRRLNAVAALPYDPKSNQVVLIEQFRAGTLWQENKSRSPWLLELVAGVMDKDKENKEELIKRELIEEAGLECFGLQHIHTYLASPGGTSEEVTIYCAKVDASKAPKFSGLAEEHEDIRVHVLPIDKAFTAVKNGTIYNAATIIALQWLELNLQQLQW